MPARFDVFGPFEIPTSKQPGGKRVDKKQLGEFWKAAEDSLPDAKGCYVFAMRAGKGMRPVYVGRASRRSFRQECFTTDKLYKLTNAMAAYERGTVRKTLGLPGSSELPRRRQGQTSNSGQSL